MRFTQPFSWRLIVGPWRFRFWSILLMGILVSLGLAYLPLQAQTPAIPSVVSQCIPQQTRQPIVRSEFIGSTQLQGQEYYLLATYTEEQSPPGDLIIAVADGSCQEVFFNPMGDRVPFASAVPQSVAQQLTLAQYRRELERIGKDRFQQQVNQSASATPNPTWFAEEVWALQQLGITVPDNIQVQP